MPSDRILEAEGERRRWREAVVSLIEPDLSGLRGEIAEVRAAQQAHETQDSQRHIEVMGAIGALGKRIDRILEHRAGPPTHPGGPSPWAPVAGAMAGAIKRASSASWPVYVVVLALVVGGPAVAGEVIHRVAAVLVGAPTVQVAAPVEVAPSPPAPPSEWAP